MIPVIEEFHVWSTLILLGVGTPAQFVFLLLYFTRQWRKYTFSRALMWKSGALALYLYSTWAKVLEAGLRNYDWPTWIDVQSTVIHAVVLLAILNQLRALIVEIAGGDVDATETEVNDKAHEEQLDN